MVFNGTTNYRHYIYAGSEPIAVYSRTSTGVNTMSYMLEDHEGGVSAIASSAGAADIDESFTVFGARRNPTTWSGAPADSDLTTIAGLSRQGYTFQTWLGQSMGLNHMNGRVQDAILGRFLSPDPHIPDPTNAQSYNRYSYVNNNPLTMVDPSGFSSKGSCDFYCPGDLHWSGGASGTESADGFSGSTEGDAFDDLFGTTDTGALTAWFNSASAAIEASITAAISLGGIGIESGGMTSSGTTAGGSSLSAPTAQDSGSAQSQQTSNSTGNGGAVGAFVGPAATAVEGATLAEIVVIAASTAAGVLLPDATSSSDTTSNNSNVPVYRVVDPTELAYLLAHGIYGSSPNQSGKYFALTAAGAQAFLNAPMNSNGTLTMTTLPGAVLSQGYAFPDPGVFGAGPSVFFPNPQLPLVYGTMAPPVVIPSVPGN